MNELVKLFFMALSYSWLTQKVHWRVRDALRDHQQARHQDRGGEALLSQGADQLRQGGDITGQDDGSMISNITG